ncbi:MAG: hypothetical protein A3H27_02545 [Acidobacteria bacterium RIFCSPLOWO2_02_FULL_59_13]|nr:MAG: hypothetical protein A3H27_02545 [Acidobacteria bacterium RIFCSPLOWO2_02_FULL_59_13]
MAPAQTWVGDTVERGSPVRDWRTSKDGDPIVITLYDLVASVPSLATQKVEVQDDGGVVSIRTFSPISGWEGLPPQSAYWLQIIMMDVDSEREDEFNEWYDREHIPFISTVKGFVAVRRFIANDGRSPRYLALWQVTDADTLVSPEWKQKAETPWTHRIRRFMRNRVRYVCQPFHDQKRH